MKKTNIMNDFAEEKNFEFVKISQLTFFHKNKISIAPSFFLSLFAYDSRRKLRPVYDAV